MMLQHRSIEGVSGSGGSQHLPQRFLWERKLILEELQGTRRTIEKIVIQLGSNLQPSG
jgi:hypothetical protein